MKICVCMRADLNSEKKKEKKKTVKEKKRCPDPGTGGESCLW